jgi:ABC-type polysaccharide/polyol phosphate transport system ATPase subunit
MSAPVLIRVDHVSKRFSRSVRHTVWHTFEDIFQQLTGANASPRLRDGEFWALRDISFEIRQRESVAVIGDNGAGKSTLIKLLMRRMLPTLGLVETRGAISALTVLGLGFDPVLSGRENILLNAATLGLSRAQTLKILDEIIDFAELREFIDAPIQTYSSGMKSRLGYAVAAHVNPDILLLDEVLAVGDIRFRRKCRRHIKNFIDGGGTTLLVTHDLHAVQTLCTRCLVLEKGRLLFDGSPTEGIHFYLETQLDQQEEEDPHGSPASLSARRPAAPEARPETTPSTESASTTESAPPTPVSNRDVDQSSDRSAHETQTPAEPAASRPNAPPPEGNSLSTLSNEGLNQAQESSLLSDPASPAAALSPVVDASDSANGSDEPDRGSTSSANAGEDSTPVPAEVVAPVVEQRTVEAPVVLESVGVSASDGKHLRTNHGAEFFMRYRSTVRIDEVAWGFTITTEDGLINIASFITGYSDRKYSILPGEHSFRVRVDRLLLQAGRYGLKAGIGEVDSGSALVGKGWEDTPIYFTVRSDPSPENGMQAYLNNLVVFDGVPVTE